VTDYLKAQIEAGIQVAMIFDTWGGILAYDDYEPFSLKYVRDIVKALPCDVLFTKAPVRGCAKMMASGVTAVGLDWSADARLARRLAAGRVACRANLDPAALFAPEKSVRGAARAQYWMRSDLEPATYSISAMASRRRRPSSPVAALVDEVRAYSRARAKNNSPCLTLCTKLAVCPGNPGEAVAP